MRVEEEKKIPYLKRANFEVSLHANACNHTYLTPPCSRFPSLALPTFFSSVSTIIGLKREKKEEEKKKKWTEKKKGSRIHDSLTLAASCMGFVICVHHSPMFVES